MKFIEKADKNNKRFVLEYCEESGVFVTNPRQELGHTSILVNYLEIEIDHEGSLLYARGLCPLVIAESTNKFPRRFMQKQLKIITEREITPGISLRVNNEHTWPIYLNHNEGWICIGSPDYTEDWLIEFAPSTVATVKDGNLIALWLKPRFIFK